MARVARAAPQPPPCAWGPEAVVSVVSAGVALRVVPGSVLVPGSASMLEDLGSALAGFMPEGALNGMGEERALIPEAWEKSKQGAVSSLLLEVACSFLREDRSALDVALVLLSAAAVSALVAAHACGLGVANRPRVKTKITYASGGR